MARSTATTVQQYLDELPDDRRTVIATVRETIVRNLPVGYQETMNWGMISYEVPLEQYPSTYNGQPLGYVAVAAQKNYYALYLSNVHGNAEQETRLEDAFRKAGKKLDMGKACLRFRTLDDVPWQIIEQIVGSTSLEEHVAQYEAARQKG